jgi:hypothetical protein
MKNSPNAITWNGSTYERGSRVRCHLGDATISRLYTPTANEETPRAMLDRGDTVAPPYARFPIIALDKLDLLP